MLFLLGGVAVLAGFLFLVYLFINADPVRLARNLKWTGIAIAAFAVLGLLVLPPVRELAGLMLPLAMSMPLLSRLRGLIARWRAPRSGQSSSVASAFLRMTLDHDTGRSGRAIATAAASTWPAATSTRRVRAPAATPTSQGPRMQRWRCRSISGCAPAAPDRH